MIKKSLLFFLSFLTAGILSAQNPEADPSAIVNFGKARFTVLSDRLLRMEWSADSVFEDNATLTFINRNLPVPDFKADEKSDLLIIKTKYLTLEYKGNERFSESNLKVHFILSGKRQLWFPGKDDSANLKGTIRTLDGSMGFSQMSFQNKTLENGILSRDGWAVVDDSENHLLVKNDSDWGEWVQARPEGDRQDLYLFAYGHDYTAALRDYTKVAGKIPLPPKYTFGYWWSRYWAYTDKELLDIAHELRENKVPADVFIVDMDWHLTWGAMQKRFGKDEFGQSRGWTGYSWNHDLFPNPQGFLSDIHKAGFKTALNLHPASGIRPYEDSYEDFVKDYLSRTKDYDGPENYVYGEEPYIFKGNDKSFATPGYSAPVPYRMSQREWADAYFNSVIHPLENQGVDFWWLDWQQWKQSKYVDNLSNTFWINYCFWNDIVRRTKSEGESAKRPLIYHRWGGLGSHRYQLGFSGDTYDEWSVLQFLPYFTATASNVGYSYWGHDIGGHMQKQPHLTDPELYTRWLQYGVFTPIFKTHSTSSAMLERKIWAYPSHYPYMKEAIELRYALSPYIYTAARETFDTGVGMCRPLYYSHPEEDEAYKYNEEFFFGNDILATVLCQSADTLTKKTARTIWFPKGNDWYDMALHRMNRGGSVNTLYYSIDENPWYVREGAVIPMAWEGLQNLQGKDNSLRLLIVPGNNVSEAVVYEDDGLSQKYSSEYAITKIEKKRSGNRLSVNVKPVSGSFEGMLSDRKLALVLEGVSNVKGVRLDGEKISLSESDKIHAKIVKNPHNVEIILPEYSLSKGVKIDVIL